MTPRQNKALSHIAKVFLDAGGTRVIHLQILLDIQALGTAAAKDLRGADVPIPTFSQQLKKLKAQGFVHQLPALSRDEPWPLWRLSEKAEAMFSKML